MNDKSISRTNSISKYSILFWEEWACENNIELQPYSEGDIRIAEQQLQCPPLPPSYRNFLLTVGEFQDGTHPHFEIENLLPISQITWFKDAPCGEAWIRNYEIPFENLGVIEDDSAEWKVSDLRKTLALSSTDFSSLFLLNSNKINQKTGEWQAWLFANWVPGAIVHASFGDLLIQSFSEAASFASAQGYVETAERT